MATPRRNQRRGKATRRWRWAALPRPVWRATWTVLALGITTLMLGTLVRWIDQPIEHLVITGSLQHVSAPDVEGVVRGELRGAGLVTVNLTRIRAALTALPWVDSASIQRTWPRGLTVQIVEQSAVARWNQSGLLNARGELFLSGLRVLPPGLPELEGPDGSQQEVTQRYLAMQANLAAIALRITTLSLDARGAWSLGLEDGVSVRLGRTDVDQRFARFLLAAAHLVRTRANDIAYVDMRYGNGFAVGWKGTAGPLATTGDHAHFNAKEKIG